MERKARLPYCLNKLSPWPRIQFSDIDPAALGAAEGNFGSERSVTFSGRWRTTHTSTQNDNNERPAKNGTRRSENASARAGETPDPREARGKQIDIHPRDQLIPTQHTKTFNDQHQQHNLGLRRQTKKIERVNQGHTADLCWYMHLQQADGVLIPAEFSSCSIHPVPDGRPDTPPESSLSTLRPGSPGYSEPSSNSRHASIDSSETSCTWIGDEVSELYSPIFKDHSGYAPAPHGSLEDIKIYGDRSEGGNEEQETDEDDDDDDDGGAAEVLIKQENEKNGAAIEECEDDDNEDPFLHLFHTLYAPSLSPRIPPPLLRAPSCTCTHTCHTYLSGPPSHHCKSCRLPSSHPQVLAALARLEKACKDIDTDDDDEDVKGGEEVLKQRLDESLRADLEFVERYDREMERRCESGVWWEGWIVVRELNGGL